MTINELRRRRVKAFRELKKSLKAVDTQVEVAERFIERILARRNKIPASEDLQRVVQMVAGLDVNIGNMSFLLMRLNDLFGSF